MGYAPDSVITALRGSYNLGVFFRLGTLPALHLSLSVNDIPIVMPSLDAPGTVYQGAGRIITFPALEVLVNGIADTVEFTLSGVDPQAVALMQESAPAVLGASVKMGIAPMDARWQPVTNIIPLWSGTADVTSENISPSTDPRQGGMQSISLTAMTGDQSRQVPNNYTYSNATQQALHPGDAFCSRTQLYRQTTIVVWPRF